RPLYCRQRLHSESGRLLRQQAPGCNPRFRGAGLASLSPGGGGGLARVERAAECTCVDSGEAAMKAIASTGCLIAVAFLLWQPVAADAPDVKTGKQETVAPKFVVYS